MSAPHAPVRCLLLGLTPDLLIGVMTFLGPHELALCESVCLFLKEFVDRGGRPIWERHLAQDLRRMINMAPEPLTESRGCGVSSLSLGRSLGHLSLGEGGAAGQEDQQQQHKKKKDGAAHVVRRGTSLWGADGVAEGGSPPQGGALAVCWKQRAVCWTRQAYTWQRAAIRPAPGKRATRLFPVPSPRYLHRAAEVQEEDGSQAFFMFGGRGSRGLLNDLWKVVAAEGRLLFTLQDAGDASLQGDALAFLGSPTDETGEHTGGSLAQPLTWADYVEMPISEDASDDDEQSEEDSEEDMGVEEGSDGAQQGQEEGQEGGAQAYGHNGSGALHEPGGGDDESLPDAEEAFETASEGRDSEQEDDEDDEEEDDDFEEVDSQVGGEARSMGEGEEAEAQAAAKIVAALQREADTLARPSARSAASLVSVGKGKRTELLLFGGQSGDQGGAFFSDLWRYDVSEGRWREDHTVGDAQAAAWQEETLGRQQGLVQHMMQQLQGEMQGGALEGEGGLGLVDVGQLQELMLGLQSGMGTDGRPWERWGHTAVTYEGMMFLFGGTSVGRNYNDLWRLDPNPSESSATSGEAPAFGGDGRTPPPRSSPPRGVWRRVHVDDDALHGAPAGRGGHAAAVVRGSFMYVFGGNTPDRAFNDMWRVDLSLTPGGGGGVALDGGGGEADPTAAASPRWELVHPGEATEASEAVPSPRIGCSMVAVDSRLYLFGGRNKQTRVFCRGVHSFDTGTRRWSQLSLPTADGVSCGGPSRTGHLCLAGEAGLTLFGGLTVPGPGGTDTCGDAFLLDMRGGK